MDISERIARWISPALARQADRYIHLYNHVDDVNRWCDGEARLATQWCLERDKDDWRPRGTMPEGALPNRISEFRRWLYDQRSTTPPDTDKSEGAKP